MVALVALLCTLLACDVADAGERRRRPEKVPLTGTVSVEKNEKDKVKAVTLTVDETAYKVRLDKNGRKLAELDGKKVEVTGRPNGGSRSAACCPPRGSRSPGTAARSTSWTSPGCRRACRRRWRSCSSSCPA